MTRPRRLAAAVLSGLLLSAAFPPLDLGPLALVALVPLLWAWRGVGPVAGALYGGAAGIAFFGVLVEWSRYFGVVAVGPFVLFLSSWWMLAGAVVGWLGRRGLTGAPVVASVWVLVEAGRGRVPFGGFPWGDVGYAFHDLGVARAVAGWGGVAVVSWMAVSVNGLLLEGALGRARREVLVRSLGGVVAVMAVAGLAAAALPDLTPTGRLRVAMVQGNDLNRDPNPTEIGDRYIVRKHLDLAGDIKDPVDLIMLPESSLDADPRQDRFLDLALSALAADHDADVLAGGNTPAPHDRLFNTVFHYRPQPADPEEPTGSGPATKEPTGTGRTAELYSKRHLVPFGEYVPWRSALSFIEELQQVPTDYEPGPGPTVFAVGDHRAGALICFESAFPALAREYARQGADALVVLTNNRSYRRSANSAQHLAMGQFRAAETGRPLLQAAISGITAVVDHTGRVRGETRLFEPTVLVGEVDTYRGRTPYTVAGEWAMLGSAVLLAAALVAARRRRSRGALMGDGGEAQP